MCQQSHLVLTSQSVRKNWETKRQYYQRCFKGSTAAMTLTTQFNNSVTFSLETEYRLKLPFAGKTVTRTQLLVQTLLICNKVWTFWEDNKCRCILPKVKLRQSQFNSTVNSQYCIASVTDKAMTVEHRWNDTHSTTEVLRGKKYNMD